MGQKSSNINGEKNMTDFIVDSDILNTILVDDVKKGKEFSITSEGFSSDKGIKETDRLTYFTFVDTYATGDSGHGDREMLLIVKRSADGVLFGAKFWEAVSSDVFSYDKYFHDNLTLMSEVNMTEEIVVRRDYSFV
jgi:hypothetical protein